MSNNESRKASAQKWLLTFKNRLSPGIDIQKKPKITLAHSLINELTIKNT